jgi:hypothetical protein
MRKLQKCRTEIIKQLCELSRNGWRNAHCGDWQPLEAELTLIESKLRKVMP